jgi:ribosomal protein S18 acetylase RimI-like enzyme
MIIRHANTSDSAALACLAEQTFRDTFTSGSSTSDMQQHCEESYSPDIQLQEIQDSNLITILAECEGKLAGFTQVRLLSPIVNLKESLTSKYPSELSRLYVSNEWLGHGVAHKLMSEVFACTASVQSDCLWLGVWEDNPRAIAFYRKYDFTVVGEHIFKVGADPQRDLIMAVQLKE